jgi:hypothetical protein
MIHIPKPEYSRRRKALMAQMEAVFRSLRPFSC